MAIQARIEAIQKSCEVVSIDKRELCCVSPLSQHSSPPMSAPFPVSD